MLQNQEQLAQARFASGRLELKDSQSNWLATFTLGSYTVTLAGPERTFTELTASVTHSVWVRTLPAPFTGQLESDWLCKALQANADGIPDILAVATQYIRDAPAMLEGELQIAGDARYGPTINGKRQEGSDFNDYLGVDWNYHDESPSVDHAESHQLHCLDCSGYIRMIWGYRHSLPNGCYADTLPLSREIKVDHSTLPRRAWQMYEGAPGTRVVPNTGEQVTDFSKLDIGDLVFFDADSDDGSAIDHVGMYLGVDAEGQHRFISSRKGRNGPTLSDVQGKSILDGTGLYAKAFRAVRRL
jgi:hypothetical protein